MPETIITRKEMKKRSKNELIDIIFRLVDLVKETDKKNKDKKSKGIFDRFKGRG